MVDRSADFRIDWRASILLFAVTAFSLARETFNLTVQPQHLIALIATMLLYAEIAGICELLLHEGQDDHVPSAQIIPLDTKIQPAERKVS